VVPPEVIAVVVHHVLALRPPHGLVLPRCEPRPRRRRRHRAAPGRRVVRAPNNDEPVQVRDEGLVAVVGAVAAVVGNPVGGVPDGAVHPTSNFPPNRNEARCTNYRPGAGAERVPAGGADRRGEERTTRGGAELGSGRTLVQLGRDELEKGPDHGWSRGRRLSRGRRRINADRRAGGGEEVARLRARSGRRDAATAQDRRDAAAALRELEAAAAALAARSGGRGATIAARVGAITVGEGVFRR
jgi:hypothetical protein